MISSYLGIHTHTHTHTHTLSLSLSHTHTHNHTEEDLNRDGEWPSGNEVRTFGQHIASNTGFILGAVSLKQPGTLQIQSIQEMGVLFDLGFYLLSFNPVFCLIKPLNKELCYAEFCRRL